MSDRLTFDQGRLLLKLARDTIQSYVRERKLCEFSSSDPVILEVRGAFVTIHKMGVLRGCIGHIEGIRPLYLTIQEMAIAAATRDPRFPPVTVSELDSIDVEISVLTPLKKITDINEIEVGKHGLVIAKGFERGLLLPQVATEQGWDRITFLQHTCLKAGFPMDAYKDPDIEIYTFSAEIFSE